MKSLTVRTIVLLLGVALEVSAGSAYRILSECDESAEVRGNISQDARIEIHFAIMGSSTCYSVTAIVDGKQVRGYVIDAGLDAVLAFEKARIKTSRDALNALSVVPQPAAQVVDHPVVNSAGGKTSVDSGKPVKELPKATTTGELPR